MKRKEGRACWHCCFRAPAEERSCQQPGTLAARDYPAHPDEATAEVALRMAAQVQEGKPLAVALGLPQEGGAAAAGGRAEFNHPQPACAEPKAHATTGSQKPCTQAAKSTVLSIN